MKSSKEYLKNNTYVMSGGCGIFIFIDHQARSARVRNHESELFMHLEKGSWVFKERKKL
jgi:hypothetical protein